MLSKVNSHPRDDKITFVEKEHEYFIQGITDKITSVTTLIHKYFPEFNNDLVINKMMNGKNWKQSPYYGKTPEEIKAQWDENKNIASSMGNKMHKSIEDFINNDITQDEQTLEEIKVEKGYFHNFWNDFQLKYPHLKPYRTEWMVYDEDIKLAGSIDCVLTDPVGNLVLLDWKRSKKINMNNRFEKGFPPFAEFDNCNYSHYSLQLNFYRHILETKYKRNIIFMMLVIFHPNQSNYKCIPVNHIPLTDIWSTLN